MQLRQRFMTHTYRASAARLLALIVCTLSVGCVGSRSYKIVAMKRVTEQWGGQDRDTISFVILHDGNTIKAHCQAWDIRNTCSQLRVGQSYGFKRDSSSVADYLSLDSFNGNNAMLRVEEESADK